MRSLAHKEEADLFIVDLFFVGVTNIGKHTKQDKSLPKVSAIILNVFDFLWVFLIFGNVWEYSVINVIKNVPNDTEQNAEQW